MVNKKMLKIAILVITFAQMATNGLSPALSDIAAAFPDTAISTIQLLMSLPGIFVVVLSFVAAWLTSKISKKVLIGIGSVCICLTGILGTFIYQSLSLLFAWSVIMGIGMGLVSALTASLITDFYEGQEKTSLMGLQTSAANVGGMIMTAVGGVLTAVAWNLDYLVYIIIGIPGLILLLLFVPYKKLETATTAKEAAPAAHTSGSFSVLKHGKVWIYTIFALLLLLLFNVGPTNLAMYVTEFSIGNSVLAGWAATIFLLGGTLMGIAFGFLAKKLDVCTIPVGYVFLALGFFVIIINPNIVCLFIGCLLAGMSISLVTPQCILQTGMYAATPQESAMATAVVLAGSNVGTFLTPQITNIAAAVSGSESTRYRFILVIVIALVLAAISLIFTLKQRKLRRT
ncbi:MFS transporter [uncultured Eubacterium sp.]|uniref:MFS transporter n=1 Tax=uncultured Eubacterium sp. TaxID=165185 RepID=UPI002592DF67|nr:MFS transporter [uncultured Eubacterium sp.]